MPFEPSSPFSLTISSLKFSKSFSSALYFCIKVKALNELFLCNLGSLSVFISGPDLSSFSSSASSGSSFWTLAGLLGEVVGFE